mmetsp:Transcript_37289/g.76430  ORF Transcript_37289/g.76430 Transcript_37289/m.76430 type:complete len:235 (+) Transcript_37289:142-846(+)
MSEQADVQRTDSRRRLVSDVFLEDVGGVRQVRSRLQTRAMEVPRRDLLPGGKVELVNKVTMENAEPIFEGRVRTSFTNLPAMKSVYLKIVLGTSEIWAEVVFVLRDLIPSIDSIRLEGTQWESTGSAVWTRCCATIKKVFCNESACPRAKALASFLERPTSPTNDVASDPAVLQEAQNNPTMFRLVRALEEYKQQDALCSELGLHLLRSAQISIHVLLKTFEETQAESLKLWRR